MSVNTYPIGDGTSRLWVRQVGDLFYTSVHADRLGQHVRAYTRIPVKHWPFGDAAEVIYVGQTDNDPQQRFEVTDNNGITALKYGNNQPV